jgi:hypothetical protein
MIDRLNMKTMKDIRANKGMSRAVMFAFIAMALIALSFMSPDIADAHLSQAGTTKVCTACHTNDYTGATGVIQVAVDGVITSSATLNNDGIDTIEIDWKFNNMWNGLTPRDGQGVLIGIEVPPSGAFTLADGTTTYSPAFTGGWNSVWDVADGVGWRASPQTNSPADCVGGAGYDCYTIDYGGTTWDVDGTGGGKNKNCACNLGGDCLVGFTDLDVTVDTMGVDAVISTTAPAGDYSIYVYGIGHNEGGTKGYVVEVVTVTVTSGPSNPPTITVNDPDGIGDTVTQGDPYNINYDLDDTDSVVTAAFYYDTDNAGLDGVAITGACATAPEGTGVTCSWDTTGVTPGSYYVYGITDDGVNPAVDDYSPGQITIDAPVNNPPTLTVNQPDGTGDTVIVGASYNIDYDLADAEEVVTVAFYYDTDAVGLDGVAITGACATAAEGTGATCSWDTTGMTPGTYYVYGIADDGVNPAVNDYSPGQITIDPAPNNPPTITVNEPDGVSDNVTQGNAYNIDYDLADAEEVVTVAFYYDTDAVGLDGVAITGACATAAEGTGATCSWDTTGVTPGNYYVYGITDDGVNPAQNDYSPGQVTISAGNTAPVLSISLPNGDTAAEGASFNITYTMTDPDDIAIVDFYYDTDNVGADGTAITECATQAEGTGVTCSWDTTGEAGTWYVYGIADDSVNTPVTSYSPGTLTVNVPPTITVNQPDGVSDTVIVGDSYNIDYDLADSDDVVTAAFYYDTDNIGLDGTAIAGACATAAEGTGVTCSWDTTGVTPGNYYVYGTTNDGVSPAVSDYSSGQITIQAGSSRTGTYAILLM